MVGSRARTRRAGAFICKLLVVTSGLTFAGVHAISTATPVKAFTVSSAVTDVNPNSIKSPCPGCSPDLFGGRTAAFAVNPINTNIVFAATDLGGLWKSTDHGGTWAHVDQVPLTAMSDVQFASSDVNLIIATGAYDGSIDNRGGGIWRSTDGGATWSQPATANVCTTVSSNNAHKMAILPGTPGSLQVFVTMDCGLAQSSDSGATWTLNSKLPGGTGYLDVKAFTVGSALHIDLCGVGFFDYYTASTDGGVTWPISDSQVIDNTSSGGFYNFSSPDACSIAVAPQDPNTVFYTALQINPEANSAIKEADDGGASNSSWHDLNVSKDGNGRPSWVMTAPGFDGVSTDFEVFYGTNSIVMHQTCSTLNTPRCADGTNAATGGNNSSGPWSVYDGSIESVHHAPDPATLAFDPSSGCPFLEGGDGGVFATSNGCNSSPTFTPSNTGQHALESYMMSGTALTGPAHTDLYNVMQDNGLLWSTDGGATWGTDGGGNSFVPDGFKVFSDRTGPPSSVLYLGNSSYTRATSDNVFSTLSFTAPPNPSSAAQFGNQSYAFISSDGAATPTYTVQVTTDAGATYHQMGPALPGGPAGLPTGQQAIVASGTPTNPVFYLNLKVSNTPTIYRLQGPMSTSATLTSASNGLSNPSVFNANPSNPLDLYAVDTAGSGAAKFSTDGGQSWQTDATLTNVVTQGGAYAFNNAAGGDISSFGFDAASGTILAGTNFTGIYASFDSGAHWAFLTGSKQLSRVTSFFFDANNAGTAYASSFGRGIWKIHLPQADLSITKSHTPDPVTAGTNLTWTITVTNSGPDPAPGVIVSDTLPAQLTYVTNNLNPPAGCSATGQTVTCNVGDLDVGQSITFKLVTFVDPATAANAGSPTSVTNTATVSDAAVDDTNVSNNTAQDTAIVVDSADLAVSKLCKPDPTTTIYPQQPINCSVFTDNLGPSYARSVVVDDTTLSNASFTVTGIDVNNNGTDLGSAGCTLSPVAGGQDLSCAVGNLANQSTTQTGRVTVSYILTATGTSANGQSLDNTAHARSNTPDPNPNNDSATVNLPITALADESLTKQGPASVVAGTPITWTLTAQNNGPSDAANTAIIDTVPAGVTITSVSMPGATCVTGVAGDPTQPATCNMGTLAHGATSTVMTVNAKVNPQTTGTLQNNARVTSSTYDGNLSNNLATTSTTVTIVSSIGVSIAATPNPVTAGTALSYALTVSNGGPSTATAVSLTDPLPNGVSFTSTGGVGTCGFQTNTNTVTCALPNLDPGQSEVVYIYTTVKASTLPQNMTNTATVTANGSPQGYGPVTTQVVTSADLSIVLTSDASLYKPSTTIHYTITVTNGGPSDAQHVVITDNLPGVKQGKYVSNNLTGCPGPSGTTLTCSYTTVPSLVTIPAGGSITFQVNFFITGNKGTITSTATVGAATSDPNTTNNTSTRNVTVHS